VAGWLVALLVALALWPVIASILTDRDGFVALSSTERGAMAWVRAETPPASRFLVVTGRSWPRDRVVEWFPVLAERVSVVTPQGTEWTTDGTFGRLSEASSLAQLCASHDAACIDSWVSDTQMAFDYLYVATDAAVGCCPSLAESLRQDRRYRVVFESAAATIFLLGRPLAASDVALSRP
jgi:hypothetical protein